MERKRFNRTNCGPEFPNLEIVQHSGTKSFIEITSRTFPSPDGKTWGPVKQDMWVEAPQGKELDWRIWAIGTLAAMQFALEHPERKIHLVRYGYRDPSVVV